VALRERAIRSDAPRGLDLIDLRDDGGVRAALRLAHDEHTIEQLQALSRENAEINEALVLRPSPASRHRFPLEPRAHGVRRPGK
jgi:hypothetical protein